MSPVEKCETHDRLNLGPELEIQFKKKEKESAARRPAVVERPINTPE